MDRVEALSLVDWLEEELTDRPAGIDPVGLRTVTALCARLRDAPGTREVIVQHAEAVEAWTRVLLSAREHWRYDQPGRAGAEVVRQRALAETRELRRVVQGPARWRVAEPPT